MRRATRAGSEHASERAEPTIPTLHPRRAATGLVVAALVVTACGGGESVDLGDGAGALGDVADIDGPVLTAAIGGDPDQLDPHATTSAFSFTVLENVYDTLVEPDADLEMQPALATDWTVSDDQLTWVLELREGVTFHDGSDFDADDVVASLERLIDEGQNGFRLEPVESITASDDLEVTLELNRPAPNLLSQLGAFKGMAIVSADDIEAGTLNTRPNGTGAFVYADRTIGDRLQLVAFEDSWRDDGPHLGGVDYRIIPDEGVKLVNLETGEVDWIDSVLPPRVEALAERDDLEVSSTAANDYWYLAFNQGREPFGDVEVRRAVAQAIDIEEVTEAVRFAAATPNQTAIPEASPWYHEYAPFDVDRDAARATLEEAGLAGTTIDLMVTDEYEETITAAEVLASQLGEVGLEVSIRIEEFNAWLTDQGEGEFDVLMLGWLGNIDPDDFYYAQHHSEGVNNSQGFADDEVDDLLDAARQETDEATRKDLYDDAAERIVDAVSYLYLYNPDLVQAWRPEVTGYEARVDQATRFTTTELAEEDAG